MRNQVQLIAYADRLGGNLAGLRALLDGPLANLFGGLHLLPFFHRIDGADAGFDPIDHTKVDARLGDWSDVLALAGCLPIMADVIVNHISTSSPQFEDYSRRGAHSPYAGMFLTLDSVFPQGITEQGLLPIYRPRPGLPLTPTTLEDGTHRILWTTFTSQQVDIDVSHPCSRKYYGEILRVFADHGIGMVRLDAVGYAVKKAGTSCFMLPETFDFIAQVAQAARQLDVEVLVEVHSHYRTQIDIASHVDWVYDFALPPLILQAFFSGTARHLKHWISVRPRNCLTVLDTHDGIGVIDVGRDATAEGAPGLLPDEELRLLVERIHAASDQTSREATGSAANNLDLYQINCTFYDAMGRDDTRYLLARAIQFFLPGIPQVYYVGLLAGSNDLTLLARTGVGRDINRHIYSRQEVEENLRRPVVARLCELIRWRNEHPAFSGRFQLHETLEHTLDVEWRLAQDQAHLRIDFATGVFLIEFSRDGQRTCLRLGEQVSQPDVPSNERTSAEA